MLNPILYTEQILSDFLRYQLTAYAFGDRDLHDQMRRLLNLEETRRSPLMKGPYFSLSRSFRKGAKVQRLVDEGIIHSHCARLLPFEHVYGHQESAFRSIAQGKTTLVSTGTGSGKSESFFIPIISRCLELRDQGAPAGIVSVLIYPMNALAEDQLTRLRAFLAGSGITFGMYVGKTVERKSDVRGQRLPVGSSNEDYRQAVKQAISRGETHAIHPPEERVSREEMRTPGEQPRILLTNVKQLELLLTRAQDVELFDGARLEFLVVDEAHTFRGASGAETACLIRRLRAFCGQGVAETTCVATSATLTDPERGPEAAREFATRFFGVNEDRVELVTEEYEPDLWSEKRFVVPAMLPGDARHHLKNVLDAVEQGDGPDAGVAVRIAYRSMTGRSIEEKNWQESLYSELSANEVVYQVAEALKAPKPLEPLLAEIGESIDRPILEEELLAWLALGAAARKEGRPLLRPVVHAFVRGVEGAVVTFPDQHDRPHLWLSAEDALQGNANPQYYPLPVMSCTTCGQHYFTHHCKDFEFQAQHLGGGDVDAGVRFWQPLDPTLGGSRLVLLDRLIADDEPESDDEDTIEDPGKGINEDKSGEARRRSHGPVPRSCAEISMCRACGTLHDGPTERCGHCGREGGSDAMVLLLVVRQRDRAPGYLTSCVACGSLGRQRSGGFREPARQIRATTVADVHVLAQNMLHHAERQRLLIFSDNRQDAAFQAGWMQDRSRRYRLRALMYEKLKLGKASVGDLTAHLDDILEADDELSRSMVPEVWRVHRKEAEGIRHQEERRRYLRIQVLRELVTGVKQRIGLEPWGRLRIGYSGLEPELAFFQTWAGRFMVEPALLVDGVAALLDIIRRKGILLDRDSNLFSRFWQDGDYLVQRGYIPKMPGIPKGLKLTRNPADESSRVDQILSSRGDTIARQTARRWGLDNASIETFYNELWLLLTEELNLFVPVTLKNSRGRALPGCAGVRQLDVDKLRLEPHKGVYRCQTCRRVHLRPTPYDTCLAWRCAGNTAFESEDPDNYDLMVLDQSYSMLRPREHTAQVPAEDRERIERMFKDENDNRVNTLVCTPTLELGVDIGALDAVLMRNVPPLPANYWQRAGRAGRRHRMAVNVTYARSVSHDRSYFREPLRILAGAVTPPRFNLRNDQMIAKHVRAAVLTILHGLARSEGFVFGILSDPDRRELQDALRICLPLRIRDYLFDSRDYIRTTPLDVTAITSVITKHEQLIAPSVMIAFRQGWPKDASETVDETIVRGLVIGFGDELAKVVLRVWKRLQWALNQLARLDEERRQRGALEPDQDALHRRCDRYVKRLKGILVRRRSEVEGYDETNTYAVLASEGFLPGYGLESGSIRATTLTPPGTGFTDFELPRPTTVALREYVPGNLIYANSSRFVPRYYHFDPQGTREVIRFQIDVASEAVTELATHGNDTTSTSGGLGAITLRAVPICDVDLVHQSQITDDEDYRFQMPVSVFAREQGRHGAGKAYSWGSRELHYRQAVHLRLVNVGEAKSTLNGNLGYPVCLVCGQSRSPLASQADRDKFATEHEERCHQRVESTGFFADVVADVLTFSSCLNREEGFSVVEAIRMGASQILDMEIDDLQIVSVSQPGEEMVDLLLYDPMPGGSGLIDQLLMRWQEVWTAAIEIVERCPSTCETSCPDCLQTFRNAYTHRHLNRRTASDSLRAWGNNITPVHDIPAKQALIGAEAFGTLPVNDPEGLLKVMLERAGFAAPICQKTIDLGRAFGGTTVPDFFYDPPNEVIEGVCIYLDGMSAHLHGDPVRAERDRLIREHLQDLGYIVITIPHGNLSDRQAMQQYFYRLGRALFGRTQAETVRETTEKWFI